MSLAVTIDAMVAAGCSPEQLAAVVRAHEAAEQERVARRRANDAGRQRRHRMSRDVTVAGCDERGHDVTPPALNDPQPNLVTVQGSQNPPPYSPPAPKNSRGTRIAADWRPSERNRADALGIGVPPAMVDPIANRFRDFWTAKAGKDAVKLDWDATWRNWCSSEADRKGWAPSSPSPCGSDPPLVFVQTGTAEWDAWQAHKGKKLPFKHYPEHQAEGWFLPTLWPPSTSQTERAA